MSQLEDWLANQRKKLIDDPDEVLRIKKSLVDENRPIYRLELLYDEENKTILLQGNSAGLKNLIENILQLANPDTPIGATVEYDRYTNLSICELELIIKRVGDDD
jgi:hypothetical protein